MEKPFNKVKVITSFVEEAKQLLICLTSIDKTI